MRRITVEERRARLGRRHHLKGPARTDDVVAIASDMVALHGTDPASVFLSAAARMRHPSVAALERALYDERALVRTLGMRRTMFVLPVADVPVVQAACTNALVDGERRRTLAMLRDSGIADAVQHLRRLEEATAAAVEDLGEATGAELSKVVPGLSQKLHIGQGTKWEGTIGVTTRVLFLLSTEQRIVRGRPKGGWTSSQYRWSPMASWLPERRPSLGAEEARVELARRWLRAFGPATVADLKWWSGLTMGQVRNAVSALEVEEVDLGGVIGIVLADDLAPVRAPRPWVALLPSLDATTMGWKQRDWYLGDHAASLFDGNGNAGPTVWCDGRVVGGWAQRRSGEVVFKLLEDVGIEVEAAIEAEAARLAAWLGEARITPRFPTPLQRELVGPPASLSRT
ncbi:MAG: winged helix DNA-binding domain-containing protein [Actinomycetota bacterium]|nr:winged helix DNA-binding domain-containing protein [Actinomycetota bacterium]